MQVFYLPCCVRVCEGKKKTCISSVSLIVCVQNSANVNTFDIITILLTIYVTDMLPQNQDYVTKAISN